MKKRFLLIVPFLVVATCPPGETNDARANDIVSPSNCDSKVNSGLVPQCSIAAVPAHSYLNNVCHLKIYRKFVFDLSPNYGSAFVYRERYLITAAHNVYQQRSRIRKIEVRCGQAVVDEEDAPDFVIESDQFFEASRFYSPVPFISKDFSDDFGVIKLPTKVFGAMPIELAETSSQKGDLVAIAGYPGGNLSDALVLYGADGRVTEPASGDGMISYDIQTYTGNSGGPVFSVGEDGQPDMLAAIHVTNSGGRVVRDAVSDNEQADARNEFALEVDRLIRLIDGRTS